MLRNIDPGWKQKVTPIGRPRNLSKQKGAVCERLKSALKKFGLSGIPMAGGIEMRAGCSLGGRERRFRANATEFASFATKRTALRNEGGDRKVRELGGFRGDWKGVFRDGKRPPIERRQNQQHLADVELLGE
jgi:hypothetical protein